MCLHDDQLRCVQVGQRVVIAFDIACGSCGACKREEYSGCETMNDSKVTEGMYGHCPCAIFGYRCARIPFSCNLHAAQHVSFVDCLLVRGGCLEAVVTLGTCWS